MQIQPNYRFRVLKKTLGNILSKYKFYYTTPTNLNYIWNVGSLVVNSLTKKVLEPFKKNPYLYLFSPVFILIVMISLLTWLIMTYPLYDNTISLQTSDDTKGPLYVAVVICGGVIVAISFALYYKGTTGKWFPTESERSEGNQWLWNKLNGKKPALDDSSMGLPNTTGGNDEVMNMASSVHHEALKETVNEGFVYWFTQLIYPTPLWIFCIISIIPLYFLWFLIIKPGLSTLLLKNTKHTRNNKS